MPVGGSWHPADSPEETLRVLDRLAMVPTTFLIDREGLVTKKLVGQKGRDTLARAFDELIGMRIATAVNR